MKEAEHIGNAHHGRIMSNGNYTDSAGNVLGNILEYIR
jgi:hypothetical protein